MKRARSSDRAAISRPLPGSQSSQESDRSSGSDRMKSRPRSVSQFSRDSSGTSGSALVKIQFDKRIGQGTFGGIYVGNLYDTDGKPLYVKKIHGDPRERAFERRCDEKVVGALARAPNVRDEYTLLLPRDTAKRLGGDVQRMCDGVTLRQFTVASLKPPKTMRPGIVRDVAIAVLNVLSLMHERNVFHGDIRPENVMICAEGGKDRIKLIDFGLCTMYVYARRSRHVNATNRLSREQPTGAAIQGSYHDHDVSVDNLVRMDLGSLWQMLTPLLRLDSSTDCDKLLKVLRETSVSDPDNPCTKKTTRDALELAESSHIGGKRTKANVRGRRCPSSPQQVRIKRSCCSRVKAPSWRKRPRSTPPSPACGSS